MSNSPKKYLLRIRRKLNLVGPQTVIVHVIYWPYYIALFIILPIVLWDDYYNRPRVWQEQSLIVIGGIGILSFLILFPPIIRNVITQSRSLDWRTRSILALIGASFYLALPILRAADPTIDDVIHIPLWVGYGHLAFAALLSFYWIKWIKNRRNFSRIEVCAVPGEAGVFTVLYGTRLSSSEEDYQGTPRSSVPVRTVTRKQIEEFKTNAGSTVVVHPDDNVNCEIVAESQPGWTFDSWLVDDKQEFSLHSTLNRIRLGGHHSDLLIFAHFVPWSDDSDLGSVKPSG